MYVVLCTRPYVCHDVSLTNMYQSDSRMEHWIAVKNILKYLRKTKNLFLVYVHDQELFIKSYVDASWDTNSYDSKSYSLDTCLF